MPAPPAAQERRGGAASPLSWLRAISSPCDLGAFTTAIDQGTSGQVTSSQAAARLHTSDMTELGGGVAHPRPRKQRGCVALANVAKMSSSSSSTEMKRLKTASSLSFLDNPLDQHMVCLLRTWSWTMSVFWSSRGTQWW